MVKFFESIYLVLSRRKRIATVILLLLIALFVGLSLQIHEEEDIAKFLPRNEQNEKYTDVYQQLSRQDQIVVIFSSRDTMDVVSADTIITAMERAGIAGPNRCRGGICGYCRSRLLSGEVYVPSDIDGRRAHDKEIGYIHPCATYPLTDIELEVPNNR